MHPKAFMNASESSFSPTKGWIRVCSRASVAPDSAVAITSTAPSRFSSTQSSDASFQAQSSQAERNILIIGRSFGSALTGMSHSRAGNASFRLRNETR
jgi:hypothetical protein